MSLHGDLSVRVAVDSETLPWTASPSGTVWRRRLHLVGPTEAGQVTSVVRFEERSLFHRHDHPEGEEILVLEGVFSDEFGDWPAGSYLLNPEGFRHAPFSRAGCLLFVKLRQFPGRDRVHVAIRTDAVAWQPEDGRAVKLLYSQRGYADTTRLERWSPGAVLRQRAYPDGAELFVLGGSFTDERGVYGRRSWLRLPAGSRHSPGTSAGCELYVKEGGLRYLRSG